MLIAFWPAGSPDVISEALSRGGFEAKQVEDASTIDPETAAHWAAFVVELGTEPLRRLRAGRRVAEDTGVPVLVIAERDQSELLADEGTRSDFALQPLDPTELAVRIRRLIDRSATADVLTYGDLELNTATYQATIDGKPIDLTYMEYELLRFFVANQGRVWSREQLLSRVWGYDYFGGARTVDVHVRRLRAKLGEERAGWITTVRSVGYRFG
jgi:DNA-binding response OmpR family regulator